MFKNMEGNTKRRDLENYFEARGQNNGTAFYGSHEFDGVFALFPLAPATMKQFKMFG